jgi:hypothetical protein
MDGAVSRLSAHSGQVEFLQSKNSKAIIRQDAGLWLTQGQATRNPKMMCLMSGLPLSR